MSGYSSRENVRKVVVVGRGTLPNRGLSAIYREKSAKTEVEDIPEDDWTAMQKQLRVAPLVTDKKGVQGPEKDAKFHFNVNIPAHFFEENKFIASPKYSKDEMIHVKLTGYGWRAGYIDMNVQGRGAGGAGDPENKECAKWS